MRTLALFALILLFSAAGCAGAGRMTEELLSQDYLAMNDQELQTYYYRLNDQIARVERQTRSTGVGFGIGTGIGSSSSVGVGVGGGVAQGTIAEDLRERRNEVRLELTRRGLRP